MICCDMCGKELKSDSRGFEVNIEHHFNFDWSFKKYIMCKRCSEKINKFIAFESTRNNKKRCEDE